MADRLALIIANGDFDDPRLSRLETPTRDAEALAQVLDDPDIGDFEVTLLVDQPEGVVRRKIGRFYHRRKRSDLLLLYYSGHGIRDEYGALYLATKDTEMDIASATALSASFVRERIDKSGSQRKVVVLDCCHSGAFAKAGLGDSVSTQDAFAGSGYGRVILTASDALELSWEGGEWLGEGKPSFFTHFLVEGLRTGAADLDGDGEIAIDELYDYVYERIVTSGHARQTPQKWALKVQGRIVIAQTAQTDISLPGWIVEALSSLAFSARLAAVGELVQLADGQDRALAAVARAELKRLSEEDNNSSVRGAAAGGLGVGTPVVDGVPSELSPLLVEKHKRKPDVLTITSPIRLELIRVPADEFLMGNDPAKDEQSGDDEQPQHTLDLPEFYIGKYPVTNRQYAAFVQATGYKAPSSWESGKATSGKANHPVVGASWEDTKNFCRWLSREIKRDARLPSEAEWEKAARGTNGRIYPWGNGPPTVALCNFGWNVGGTTPVGKYSTSGDSPYGCADMAGNVTEWTRSLSKGYPYDPEDGREDLGASGLRVVRGGSFLYSAGLVRCAARNGLSQYSRYGDGGFRVVVAPFSLSSEL